MSVDPDQLASEEANWSGSALFIIQYMYQQLHYENTPIQIYGKFYHQKMKNFQLKNPENFS